MTPAFSRRENRGSGLPEYSSTATESCRFARVASYWNRPVPPSRSNLDRVWPLLGAWRSRRGYERVFLICRDGTQADTTVLDCVERIGFNVYVAEVLSFPLRVVATNELGHAVSKLTCQPSFWLHETPEAAALDGLPTDSQVRVVSVEVRGDRAEVVLNTDTGWPNWVYCIRTRERWHEAISANGPTTEWDDPWPDPMTPPPE